MQTKLSATHRLVIMALLVAITVILSRFLSISTWNLKIGFAFLPVALAGILLGPISAAVVAALADFVGAILFPIAGFFPGFTFTAFLTGLLFGLFLHKKASMKNIILASLTTQIFGSLLLNSYWISVISGTPFMALMPARVLQTCVMIAFQIILIRLMAGYAPQIFQIQKA